MTLQSGSRLGPYEILSLIGVGGMGEVYRAKDTRLDRTVAIKVLPSHLSEDADRRERFEREARAVSSLNHPHICTLHDVGEQDGTHFLVMEYIEGETLADRLNKGPLPLDQALGYAVQIADALDKAHRQGVVHRDLKPGNIMLTQSGAKLLDFGLAKLRGTAQEGLDFSSLPTEQKPLTEKGAILGTFQYMAPEQLEGKDTDARTDIFALGTVLYEMLVGRKAFQGKSQASLIAAILEHEPPPVSELQPLSPPALDYAIKTCLAKDPDRRWQSAADLTRQFAWISDGGTQPSTELAPPRSRGRIATGILGVLAGVLLGGIAIWNWKDSNLPAKPISRWAVDLPPDQRMLETSTSHPIALSPDGTQLIYSARTGAHTQLYLRQLDRLDVEPIPGSEGAFSPFFSPDGLWVGFYSNDRLRKVSLAGGVSQAICETPPIVGASWADDDTIVFASRGRLFRVSATGGTPTVLIGPDTQRGESLIGWPHVLPKGKGVLFSVQIGEGSRIAILSKSTDRWHVLERLGEARRARYIPTGHLVYGQVGGLRAVPFDLERLELSGSAFSILDGVYTYGRVPYFAVSRSGSLAYVPGDSRRDVVWIDREGRSTPLPIEPGRYTHVRLSPDGERVALDLFSYEGGRDIWLFDIVRGTRSRVTVTGNTQHPVWTPDGQRITFNTTHSQRAIYWKAADGSGEAEQLWASENNSVPISWSPHGLLGLEERTPSGNDIWVFSASERSATPFLNAPYNETSPIFSPDGRWMAYVSDESGRQEVYVQPYPGPGEKWTISTDGGREPIWTADGRELFYRNGDEMWVVATKAEPTFSAGKPQLLFEGQFVTDEFGHPRHDFSNKDQRFLMIQLELAPTQVNVVLNWFEELKRLVPSNR